MADEPLAKPAPEPEQQAATIVTVGKDEPYPTGAPPDFSAVLLRVHTPQELTDGPVGQDGSAWERQKIQNLAAVGMIAGGMAGT
jgi:hypothetical protein